LLIRYRDGFLNGGDGKGDGLPIEIADGDGHGNQADVVPAGHVPVGGQNHCDLQD
jgi:hypothetical protein